MKAALRLEYIGAGVWDKVHQFERASRRMGWDSRSPDWDSADDYLDLPGPRVIAYRVSGPDAGQVGPIRGFRDYANSSSTGNRGVMVVFTLEEGAIYQVKEPRSWRSSDRYFCVVSPDGDVLIMPKEECLQWASDHWV